MKDKILTSIEAAKILGITSKATIENWLHGGYFPGASQTEDGKWSFKLSDVIAVKEDIDEVARNNAMKSVTTADFSDMREESEE
jgi:hypothetical protein